MTWDIPGRLSIPPARSGRVIGVSDLRESVLQDRALRANRHGVVLAHMRAGDVASPARDWLISPAEYGAPPSAGVFPFRLVEGLVCTVPLPIPGSEGREEGTASDPGAMRFATRGTNVEIRVTLTDLETLATSVATWTHGGAGWLNEAVPLPALCRSGNRIRIDVDLRWTHASEAARVGSVCAWWGACTDVRALDPPPSIPTDDITWAYSVARRLHSGYTGPLIRAVRLSDDAERDIGANAQWNLDTVDLLAWAGTADVRIDTIYDQSGNDRHMEAWSTPSKTNWYRIANDGAVETANGRPCANSVAGIIYRWDNAGSNLFLANDLTCYTVCAHDGSGGTTLRTIFRSVNSANNRFFGLHIRPSEGKWRHYFRGTGSTNPELSVAMDSVTRLFTGQQRSDGTTELWVNGTSVDTGTTTVNYGAGAVLELGNSVGTFQELLIYRDAHDNTVRGEVDGIVIDYYGLP